MMQLRQCIKIKYDANIHVMMDRNLIKCNVNPAYLFLLRLFVTDYGKVNFKFKLKNIKPALSECPRDD